MPRVPPSNRNFSLRFWRRPTVVRVGTLGSGVSGLGWLTLPMVLMIAAILLPIATMLVLALTGSDANWAHLWRNVLPRSVTDTAILALGVALTTSVVGCATAWLVTMHEFPGRAIFDRLLVLPLAIPTYIVAYCYVEVFDYSGPVQATLRWLLGAQTSRDYWFPDIRSMGGAILVLSAVLYPYVYLSARASFIQQSGRALEVARTLGHSELAVFWSVAIPLARPALIAGTALAMMECLNDLGAVEYLGIETLAVTIYTTWIQRASLGGAAQIATIMLLFVFALFTMEQASRGGARYVGAGGKAPPIAFSELTGWRGIAAAGICALPVLFGFVVPLAVLIDNAVTIGLDDIRPSFFAALRHSLTLAAIAALLAVAIGFLLAYAQRISSNTNVRATVRLAALGYAIPGTVLGLGLLTPLAGFDAYLNSWSRYLFGLSSGQIFAGTIFTLVLAYLIRYLAVALGAIDAGFQRISPNLDAAARTQGETTLTILWRVHLPILIPVLGAAGLMVFVDTMKELPATLLLRPFNFETLATEVYNRASLAEFEEASFSALAILVAGLAPVLLLHRTMAGRPERHRNRRPKDSVA
jgi:iron(III) transport system permease protein